MTPTGLGADPVLPRKLRFDHLAEVRSTVLRRQRGVNGASKLRRNMAPPFTLIGTRYDQSTYAGRYLGCVDMIDPRTLFTRCVPRPTSR